MQYLSLQTCNVNYVKMLLNLGLYSQPSSGFLKSSDISPWTLLKTAHLQGKFACGSEFCSAKHRTKDSHHPTHPKDRLHSPWTWAACPETHISNRGLAIWNCMNKRQKTQKELKKKKAVEEAQPQMKSLLWEYERTRQEFWIKHCLERCSAQT